LLVRLFLIVMVTVLILAGCGGGDAEQQYLQMEREAQDSIAACMAEHHSRRSAARHLRG
jgi:uncharacterized lipoprotein YmbA